MTLPYTIKQPLVILIIVTLSTISRGQHSSAPESITHPELANYEGSWKAKNEDMQLVLNRTKAQIKMPHVEIDVLEGYFTYQGKKFSPNSLGQGVVEGSRVKFVILDPVTNATLHVALHVDPTINKILTATVQLSPGIYVNGLPKISLPANLYFIKQ